MALHYQCEGYTFRADAQTLSIKPGPKSITLTRWELERLGLIFQDVHPLRFDTETEKEGVVEAIMGSLTGALSRSSLGCHSSAPSAIDIRRPKPR